MGNQEETSWACVEAIITGLVQGVGFRFFVERVAKRYGLTGYVINLQGEGVKVLAEGPREALSFLLHDLREGPPLSSVEAVEVHWKEYRGRFNDFSIRFYEPA